MPAAGEDPGRVPRRRSLDTCANQPRLETENTVLAAVVNTAPTDPPVTVRDWPDPTLRAGWVMVRVIRAALNRLDAMTLAERHTLARPAVIGSDAAGVVTAIGAHASAVDQGPSRRHAGQAGASEAGSPLRRRRMTTAMPGMVECVGVAGRSPAIATS